MGSKISSSESPLMNPENEIKKIKYIFSVGDNSYGNIYNLNNRKLYTIQQLVIKV